MSLLLYTSTTTRFSRRILTANAWTVVTNTSFQSAVASTRKLMMTTTKTQSGDATTTTTSTNDALAAVRTALDNSWITQLSAETPDNLAASYARMGIIVTNGDKDYDNTNVNQTKRPVLNGHYVLVRPTGLNQPHLLLTSESVAKEWLGLTTAQVDSDDFVQWVSGNLHVGPSWATPYALSIMGTRYTHNCPFGDGTGYGDGRAIR